MASAPPPVDLPTTRNARARRPRSLRFLSGPTTSLRTAGQEAVLAAKVGWVALAEAMELVEKLGLKKSTACYRDMGRQTSLQRFWSLHDKPTDDIVQGT